VKPKRLTRLLAVPALAGLALAATGSIGSVGAQGWRGSKTEPMAQSRARSTPLLAVVALGEQRITIYDASGRMLQAPVSTGSTGYETPAGVFSIVQKKEMHESNLYEDGKMPFMQRITWTGIALHAGNLPGHPASHGCVRMPLQFAEHLFPLTDLGLRVVIVRDDIAPGEIAHPALPRSSSPWSPQHLSADRSMAAAKAAEVAAAAKRASDVQRVVARMTAEAGFAAKAVRIAEAELAKAQEQHKAAQRAVDAISSPPQSGTADVQNQKKASTAQQRLEKASEKITEIEARLQAARAQAQAKAESARRAFEDAKAADAAKNSAADAAEKAKRKGEPVSLFISRKTQRYYIRQGFEPVHEGPVTIRDPERPLGTYVFTALNHVGAEQRWNVVSMYKAGATVEPAALGTRPRGGSQQAAAPADVDGARAALDRIVIPREALEQIPEVVLPGSSVIVSDEGPSIETGKDTDFVVVMSGEPQGALKVRKREPFGKFDDDDWFGGRSSFGPPFGSSNKGGYRGYPFFR
jgi:L,D-transpeptidase catalytic domain